MWIFIVLFFAIIGLIALVNYKLNSEFKIESSWLALGLAPMVIWLITAGQLSEFSGFGLAFKLNQAKAAPLSMQTDGNVIRPEKISSDEKGSYKKIDLFKRNRIAALTLKIGKKGYYVNHVIIEYLTELTPKSFFKYVLFVNESGEFKGIISGLELLQKMQDQGLDLVPLIENGEALDLVGVNRISVKSNASKQISLQLMEENGLSELPVINGSNVFVGVVERNKITSSIVAQLVASTDK